MGAQLGSGRKNRRGGRPQAFSEINITPMVDVMLVLLIIFMVAAPMMTSGVTVDLPESSAGAVGGQDEPLSVTVAADGKVYIQKTPVTVKDLGTKLTAIAGEKKDTRIFVRGDRNVDYGKVMQVFGEISSAGFTKIALISEQPAAQAKGR